MIKDSFVQSDASLGIKIEVAIVKRYLLEGNIWGPHLLAAIGTVGAQKLYQIAIVLQHEGIVKLEVMWNHARDLLHVTRHAKHFSLLKDLTGAKGRDENVGPNVYSILLDFETTDTIHHDVILRIRVRNHVGRPNNGDIHSLFVVHFQITIERQFHHKRAFAFHNSRVPRYSPSIELVIQGTEATLYNNVTIAIHAKTAVAILRFDRVTAFETTRSRPNNFFSGHDDSRERS
mmetsp:Transcript_175/g.290  ORF Transcript_175/g.290 Transcript_175/m.290 type:complete len:232 (-) Transcript_175:427-1122(-)